MEDHMNKKELVSQLAKRTGLSQIKCRSFINELFGTGPTTGVIEEALHAGDKFVIPGFGTFGTRTRKTRQGSNPVTGEKIEVPSKTYVYFKAGKNLRTRLATRGQEAAVGLAPPKMGER